MKLAGQTAAIFSPQGVRFTFPIDLATSSVSDRRTRAQPAGIFALFPGATQGNGYLFLNERTSGSAPGASKSPRPDFSVCFLQLLATCSFRSSSSPSLTHASECYPTQSICHNPVSRTRDDEALARATARHSPARRRVTDTAGTTSFFVALPSAPFVIGLGYFVIINGFAVNSVALNAARDVPGRMVCAMFFGKGKPDSHLMLFQSDTDWDVSLFPECYTGYKACESRLEPVDSKPMLTFSTLADTAIAALTCFPASIIGAAFHTIFMSDSAKMIVNHRAFSLSPRVAVSSSPNLSSFARNSALDGGGDQHAQREPRIPDHQPRHHSRDCLPRHERHGIDQVLKAAIQRFRGDYSRACSSSSAFHQILARNPSASCLHAPALPVVSIRNLWL